MTHTMQTIPRMFFLLLINLVLPANAMILPASVQTSPGSDGDYRSVRSGDWHKDSTWARCAAGVWITPAPPPDSSSGVVTVRTGHSVTIRSTLAYDQVVVEEGGQVVVAPGTSHTLTDGPGNDLIINGTWVNQGSTWTISGSARWVVNDGGTFVQNTSSGISTPLSKAALSRASSFVYRGGTALVPASSFSGRTYGNLAFDSSGGMWTCSAAGSSALTISGNLTIGTGVKWNTSGFAGAILVQGATTIEGEWGGTGSGNQGTHTFAGAFSVLSTGKYALSTSGAVQGGLVFQSDLTNHGSLSTPSNRTILLIGQSVQSIAGSAALTFNRSLTVNNPAGVLLECPVSLEDTLFCVAGNLCTGRQLLTVGSKAALVERDCSSVVGKASASRALQNGVTESFGNLGLDITPASPYTGTITVMRETSSPQSIESVRTISRCFDVVPSVSANSAAEFRYHFNECDLSGAIKANLKLYKSSDGGATWRDEGGIVDSAKNTIRLDAILSASRWVAGEPIPTPTIGSVSPAFAESGSSLSLSVSGTGFVTGISSVSFSGTGITVASISVISATHIIAGIVVSPFAPLGVRDITVTNASGSASMLANCFEVRPHLNPFPVITGMFPASGFRGGAAEVVVRGRGFANGLTVASFGEGIVVGNTRVAAETELIVSIALNQGAQPGMRNVSVANPPPGGGLFIFPNGFLVLNPAPLINTVSPITFVRGETSWISLRGKDLYADATRLDVGEGITLDSLVVESSTILKARINIAISARTGERDLALVNAPPGGGSARLPAAMNIVNPSPIVRMFAPDTVIVGQQAELTLDGSGFIQDVTSVRIGNGVTVDSVVVRSGSRLTANALVAMTAIPGPRDVTATNNPPGGGTVTLPGRVIVASPHPRIDSIAPAIAVGGTRERITVRGGGYVPGLTRLDFGAGIRVDSMEFYGSSCLVASISISGSIRGGARDVALMNPGPGGGATRLSGALVINNPVPIITSLSATSGSRGNTFTIMVNGGNFTQGVTSLVFGEDVNVDSVRVTSPDCLFAGITVSRLASTGLRDVQITNCAPGGGSRLVRGAFAVTNPSPVLREISPRTVCIGETITLKLNGSGYLDGVTTLDLGAGIAVGTIIIDSLGREIVSIISVDRTAAAGCQIVQVSNAKPGGGTASLPNALELVYPAPVLASIAPLGGNRSQAFEITITGRNFIPGATKVGVGADVEVKSIMVKSSVEMRGTVTIGAEAALGQRTVVVSNPSPGGGASALTNAFTIANSAPMLAHMTPSAGARGDTLDVLLEGMNFTVGETRASFGDGIIITSLTRHSSSVMTVRVAIATTAEVGPRDVALTTAEPGGGQCRLCGAFAVVNPSPIVTSVSPSAGCRGKTYVVSVTGSRFESGISSSDFGSGITVTALRIDSPEMLTAVISIGVIAKTGVRPVIVRNKGPGGGTASLAGAFAVWNPSPALTAVSPAECVRGRSLQVTLTGENFIAGETSTDFGPGVTVQALAVKNGSEISVNLCVDRSAEPGPRAVSITNGQPGGGVATLVNGFLVQSDVASLVLKGSEQAPTRNALNEAFPNPFNGRTAISYQLSVASLVTLKVFDLLGREVALLVNGEHAAGVHQAWFDAGDRTSGMYFVCLVAESMESRARFVASKKIVLVR
ncbi:MAG: T9SS type A sorting domain-containing protein [Ignavibacteriales bacterium]|nr:T9SS type A sorting domain-containing protein [Ignavibacteriales bacterium]